ncbi:MAG TPA: MATE family efflux transporter, partial [Bacteroidales bacterium]|nr:MATE family efflux transporter [Bacteroidales bacterium]
MSIITINKSILRLAIPNIVTNITVPLLGLVDLALMGHLQDPVYIGAIALGSIIFNVIYSGF